jgi:hypothetical protein
VKRINQTGPDDCFAACIAALLEVPRAKVPTFTLKSAEAQTASAARRLVRKHGLTLATIFVPDGLKLADVVANHAVPARFIAVVPVGGGEWHAVVAGAYPGERLRILHDPSPEKWPRLRLSLANEIRFLVPKFTKGSKRK